MQNGVGNHFVAVIFRQALENYQPRYVLNSYCWCKFMKLPLSLPFCPIFGVIFVLVDVRTTVAYNSSMSFIRC